MKTSSRISLAICVLFLPHCALAHSFFTVPIPFSTVEGCRLGGPPGFQSNCPGPCPNVGFRNDTAPDLPTATYKRGDTYEIRYTKNNHFDGFLRLSFVPLDEMFSKDAHAFYAFRYACWSATEFFCNEYEKQRDCHYDFENKAYKTDISIPTVIPDGVYVFGFAWYGGGRDLDSFGDYYDCAYVEIKGGPLTDAHSVTFESPNGYCDSQSDKIGDCAVEPCYEHETAQRAPPEFKNGNPTIFREAYEEAAARPKNQVIVSRHEDFGVNGIELIDSATEKKIDFETDSVTYMDATQKISMVPTVYGNVDYVQWFVNGKYQHDAKSYPWSIGDHEMTASGVDYYDWIFPYFNERCYVTVIVYNGNRRSYFSKEFVFRVHGS